MSDRLLTGDNLPLLRKEIPSGSVDLIYLDPPFNSDKQYTLLREPDKLRSTVVFSDLWRWDENGGERFRSAVDMCPDPVAKGLTALRQLLGDSGMIVYLAMMAPRLVELRRVLKPSGSLYLHCDGSAVAPLRLLCDLVFGRENYLSTVVWCYGLGGSSHRRWPAKHDDILWYAKEAGKHYFQPVMIPARSQRMKGKLKKAPDYWYIPSINNMAKERCGWPTQKPLELLERIVISSSPPEGVVLDPFCGSGTTLVAAKKQGRGYIGIDANPLAVEIARSRLLL